MTQERSDENVFYDAFETETSAIYEQNQGSNYVMKVLQYFSRGIFRTHPKI